MPETSIGHALTAPVCAAIKNLRGEYYLNGHWAIEFSRAAPIAGTVLYYQRGAEGDNIPETIIGRGPTTEPLVVEVRYFRLFILQDTIKEPFQEHCG